MIHLVALSVLVFIWTAGSTLPTSVLVGAFWYSLSHTHAHILLQFTKQWCIEKQRVRGWVEIGGEKANCRGNVLHHSNEPITTFLHSIKSLAPFSTFMTLRGQHTSSFSTVNLGFSLSICLSIQPLLALSASSLSLISALLLVQSSLSPLNLSNPVAS